MPDPADLPAQHEFEDSPTFYGLWGMVFGGMSIASILSPYSTLGIAGTAAFGAYSLWLLRHAVFPRVRVRVSKEGILDETGWGSLGLIAWKEVIDVRRSRWGGIEVTLRDEEGFVGALSPLARMLTKMRRLMGHGPATLHCWTLAPDTESIFRALEDEMDRYALRSINDEAAESLPASSTTAPRASTT